MGTELVNPSQLDINEIAKITGQYIPENTGFPQLKINRDFVDDNENELVPGTFSVKRNDELVYSKVVDFRPFINSYQYAKWDPKGGPDGKGAWTNRSVIFRSFMEEILDEGGGFKCGKIKDVDGLGLAEAEEQKKIKCFRMVFGMAHMKAPFNAKKEKRDDFITPVVLRVRGVNFMPIDDVFKKLSKAKKPIFAHSLSLSTKRQKNGDTTYYLINYELNDAVSVPFTEEDFGALKDFDAYIRMVNNDVIKKHENAVRKANKDAAIDAKYGAIDVGSLMDDLNDPPFDVE
jgi:hypothetical protein